MGSRAAILAALLGASIGVPMVVSKTSGDPSSTETEQVSSRSTPAAYASARSIARPQSPRPGGSAFDRGVSNTGPQIYSLAEVLRMDVTKEWVYAHWARKSTGLADPERFGIRVALVTGTSHADLAGSLTYYFNAHGQVDHISLRGRTGDTTQVVQLLTQRYDFKRQPPTRPGEQLFQVKWNGRVQSEFRSVPDEVLWSTSAHRSFLVELELERPGTNRYVERPAPQLMIPTPDGGTVVAPTRAEPRKPVAVGPMSMFQRVNNTIVGSGSEPLEGPAPAKEETQTTSKPVPASSAPPVKVPRPAVRWPG